MRTNIFIDANVILDLFDPKRPFHKHSTNMLKKFVENEDIELFISSDMVSNIFYILKNRLKFHLESSLSIVENIVKVFNIISIDKYDIFHGINLCKNGQFSDFEDALQYICALKAEAELIISNDKKGFKNSEIPVKTSNQIL
jgi:predicted nucleic acid-binding protein